RGPARAQAAGAAALPPRLCRPRLAELLPRLGPHHGERLHPARRHAPRLLHRPPPARHHDPLQHGARGPPRVLRRLSRPVGRPAASFRRQARRQDCRALWRRH
ncbi:hypothetical protein BN1708_019907, partial [Verticillium longisporum]